MFDYNYRSELHQVGEQLVAQHLHVSRLQQQGQADPEKLCIEKIAEQQLRIKQVIQLLYAVTHTYTHTHTHTGILKMQWVFFPVGQAASKVIGGTLPAQITPESKTLLAHQIH